MHNEKLNYLIEYAKVLAAMKHDDSTENWLHDRLTKVYDQIEEEIKGYE